MRKLIYLVLFALIATPTAFAQDRYIADKLFTYMHAGPNNTYRIIGSVNAGEKITLLKANTATGYSQISDVKGRTGWVESKFISRKESITLRLPKLEKELKEVKERLANARTSSDTEKAGLIDSLDARNAQISELEKNYSEISEKLLSAQTDIRQLRAKLDTQKEDLLLKYFMYGGGVAGIGLLFGLLLPHIIPRRKKSPNGWA